MTASAGPNGPERVCNENLGMKIKPSIIYTELTFAVDDVKLEKSAGRVTVQMCVVQMCISLPDWSDRAGEGEGQRLGLWGLKFKAAACIQEAALHCPWQQLLAEGCLLSLSPLRLQLCN